MGGHGVHGPQADQGRPRHGADASQRPALRDDPLVDAGPGRRPVDVHLLRAGAGGPRRSRGVDRRPGPSRLAGVLGRDGWRAAHGHPAGLFQSAGGPAARRQALVHRGRRAAVGRSGEHALQHGAAARAHRAPDRRPPELPDRAGPSAAAADPRHDDRIRRAEPGGSAAHALPLPARGPRQRLARGRRPPPSQLHQPAAGSLSIPGEGRQQQRRLERGRRAARVHDPARLPPDDLVPRGQPRGARGPDLGRLPARAAAARAAAASPVRSDAGGSRRRTHAHRARSA